MTVTTIDAHQHFWSLATPGHEWPTGREAAIHRDFGSADLAEAARGVALAGTVVVQSQPTDADTDWLLALARRDPMVRGVVGWVDLADPGAAERITALAGSPKLRGLRPMLQSIAETDWLLGDALTPALEAMAAAGLRLDCLVQPRHLPMLARFAERWPTIPAVIDHAAKPHLAAGTIDPWRDDIAVLARAGYHCKLSGLRTEQAPGQPAEAIMPCIEHLIAHFGARLMWGSDWPVVLLSGDGWRQWHDDAVRLAGRAGADLDRLFSGAATDFYDLERQDEE